MAGHAERVAPTGMVALPRLQVREPGLAPNTILCCNYIESSLGILDLWPANVRRLAAHFLCPINIRYRPVPGIWRLERDL